MLRFRKRRGILFARCRVYTLLLVVFVVLVTSVYSDARPDGAGADAIAAPEIADRIP